MYLPDIRSDFLFELKNHIVVIYKSSPLLSVVFEHTRMVIPSAQDNYITLIDYFLFYFGSFFQEFSAASVFAEGSAEP